LEPITVGDASIVIFNKSEQTEEGQEREQHSSLDPPCKLVGQTSCSHHHLLNTTSSQSRMAAQASTTRLSWPVQQESVRQITLKYDSEATSTDRSTHELCISAKDQHYRCQRPVPNRRLPSGASVNRRLCSSMVGLFVTTATSGPLTPSSLRGRWWGRGLRSACNVRRLVSYVLLPFLSEIALTTVSGNRAPTQCCWFSHRVVLDCTSASAHLHRLPNMLCANPSKQQQLLALSHLAAHWCHLCFEKMAWSCIIRKMNSKAGIALVVCFRDCLLNDSRRFPNPI
jgi:hypothetical protein